ncbi:TetR/AcrR family transcriptional regulator [Amycolatopsis jiangsuensis]|uniref:AcrR family transcriptional regulator n=1 Tax=Amycolatopsis jiangsuensis TaxID=1181879 RepID=A0A840IUW5_9PSEU|nr:TetR/AcrR family transcriptional regulator [Amycolatopsis jiangsuensis]MBB4685127.1 AcrR family transcriptional regulator [Amycolatopsis jiangsuensis]
MVRTPQRRPGREPAGAAVLRESVTEAIAAAMFGELADVGYARMSMEAVARRAGVGKAAVYRRWPSKEAMLIDLVGGVVRRNLPEAADTGTFAGDVRALLEVTLEQARHSSVIRIVLDLIAETARTPSLASALSEAVGGPRRAAVAALVTRAVARNELPADVDLELAVDLLLAPLVFRLGFTGGPIDEGYLTRLTGSVCAAIAVARPVSSDSPAS